MQPIPLNLGELSLGKKDLIEVQFNELNFSNPIFCPFLKDEIGITFAKGENPVLLLNFLNFLEICGDPDFRKRYDSLQKPIPVNGLVPFIEQKIPTVSPKEMIKFIPHLKEGTIICTGSYENGLDKYRNQKNVSFSKAVKRPMTQRSYYPQYLLMNLDTADSLFGLGFKPKNKCIAENEIKEEEIYVETKREIGKIKTKKGSLDDLIINKENLLVLEEINQIPVFKKTLNFALDSIPVKENNYGVSISSRGTTYVILDILEYLHHMPEAAFLDQPLKEGGNIISIEGAYKLKKYKWGAFVSSPTFFKEPFMLYLSKQDDRPLLVIPSRK
jgi:hypothetical protein